MIKLVSLSGSPVENSSTEILLQKVAASIQAHLKDHQVEHTLVRLNDLEFIPCQSCGKAPTPKFCFYNDDITALYDKLALCDCLLLGSPVYFDAISAQAKALIDRCNCFRPPDFDNVDSDHDFIKLIKRKRPGAMVLVGSEGGWFEGARRCIAGFFKWVEVINEGILIYRSRGLVAGSVMSESNKLKEAEQLGRHLASVLAVEYEQR